MKLQFQNNQHCTKTMVRDCIIHFNLNKSKSEHAPPLFDNARHNEGNEMALNTKNNFKKGHNSQKMK